MLEFRLRMYVIGQYVRWLMIVLAAGMVTFGGPEAQSYAPTVYLGLLVASCYNLALYVIPWQRMEEAGRGNLIAVPYVLADTVCISIVVYATGKIDSSYYLAYLLLVVWMAIYPGTRERRWLWLVLLGSYAAAVFADGQATSNAVYSFLMRAIIFGSVAWLSGRIAHELHLATSRVETAVTDLTDGLVVLDRAGRVLLMNPRAVALLGVSEAEALGQSIHQADLPEPLASLHVLAPEPEEAARSAHDARVLMHEVALGPRPERVVRVYSVPYRDEQGRRAGELRVLHDVTDLKTLDRLRAELISALTHDLCNPLSTVRTILDYLNRRMGASLDADGARMLRSVRAQTDRLIRMSREMLDFARMEAGSLEFSMGGVALNAELEAVVEGLRWDADERGLELSLQVDPELPPVWGDTDRLVRVIYNLVENALKFTPAGGSVHVISRRCPTDPRLAQVTVSDTGPGIAGDQLERIFDRFVRVGDELTLKTRGAGLGLSICRDLISAHGGTVWVDSQPGRGSDFHFTVPLVGAGQLPAAHSVRAGG